MAYVKPPQILQLTPASEILFEGPFDQQVVTSYLELQNPSERRIVFKVKTTAPRRYCVRPNSGIVDPGSKIKIAIMLQPMDQDSQSERNKHKFMVQSAVMKDESHNNMDLVWQTTLPDEIMDSKLRCVFRLPGGGGTENAQPATAEGVQTTSSVASNVTNTPDLIATSKSTASSTTAASTKAAATNLTQQTQKLQQQATSGGDGQNTSRAKESESSYPTSSTAAASSSNTPRTLSTATSKPWSASSSNQQSPRKSDVHDKSIASSHNLTASFLQPMSDDYKLVLVSLIMLIVGVILGKYII